MVAIKLQRIGKKKQPSYRIVVQPKRSKLNGRFIEDLGWYHPVTKKSQILVNRLEYWLKSGARPTPTVHNLLVREGILKLPKIPVHKKIEKKAETAIAAA
ncbi:MAG: 30S ribosomal protein S16 [bacterium]|nr:30S ribosomal protein S16 [bacterium]